MHACMWCAGSVNYDLIHPLEGLHVGAVSAKREHQSPVGNAAEQRGECWRVSASACISIMCVHVFTRFSIYLSIYLSIYAYAYRVTVPASGALCGYGRW